jgi:hypothetical protein
VALSIQPQPCPAGFFCGANASSPTPCSPGFYCPPAAATPVLCPLGHHFNATAALRTSVVDSCVPCAPGSYSEDARQAECLPCTAGFVCEGATTSATPRNRTLERGAPCPPGSFCPQGSSVPVPCPRGSFNPSSGAINVSSCLSCPAGTYSELSGTSSCTRCGSSAWSLPEATTCTCNGTYRRYQPSDGSCLCEPGYEYYDESKTRFDGDSALPCQPIVFALCASNELRDANGRCVSNEPASCSAACSNSGGGRLNPDMGVCVCANAVEPDLVCNASCRGAAPLVSLLADGRLSIIDPRSTRVVTTPAGELAGLFGRTACEVVAGCDLVPVVAGAAGHTAVYGLPGSLAQLNSTALSGSAVSSASALQRLREARDWTAARLVERVLATRTDLVSTATESLSEVVLDGWSHVHVASGAPAFAPQTTDPAVLQRGFRNPTVCLRPGGGLYFDLSDPSAREHYPVYVRDSLLNTNPRFDFGAFRRLAQRLRANATSVSAFVFTFDEPGVYVLADAAEPARLTIVSVLTAAQSCPESGPIQPTSAESLVALGVSQRRDISVEPDLVVVAAFIASFVAVALVIGLYQKLKRGRFSSKDDADFASGFDMSATRSEFVKLYRKLEEQRVAHESLFSRQKRDFQAECDRLVAETDQVKALLAVKMTSGGGSRAFLEAAERLLLAEISARTSYERRQRKREEEITELLRQLQRLLKSPPEFLVPSEVPHVKQLVKSLLDLVAECQDARDKERIRRRGFASNSGIVGEEVMAELNRGASEEQEEEDQWLSSLRTFGDAVRALKARMDDAELRFVHHRNELIEAHNAPGVQQLTERHHKTVRGQCHELEALVDRLLGGAIVKQQRLNEVRQRAKTHHTAAHAILQQQMRESDLRGEGGEGGEAGIFRGLSPQLAHALSVYLAESAKDLQVVRRGLVDEQQPGLPAASVLGGGGGGGGSHLLQVPGAASPNAGGATSPRTTQRQIVQQRLEQELERVGERVRATAESERIAVLTELAAMPHVTHADIMRVDEDLQLKRELLDRVISTGQERTEQLQREELSEAVSDPADQALLAAAQSQLDELRERHRREEQRLEAEMAREEAALAAAELRAQEEKARELEAERERMTAELQNKLRVVNSQEERSGVIKEHQLQLRKLEDVLTGDRGQTQDRLKKLQLDLRQKKARQREDLKAKQRREVRQQQAQVEKVRSEVERHTEGARSEHIPGLVELERSLAAAAAAASGAPGTAPQPMSAAEAALRREQARLLNELDHAQDAERHQEQQQLDRERQQQLATFERESAERKAAALEGREREFEVELAARRQQVEQENARAKKSMTPEQRQQLEREEAMAVERMVAAHAADMDNYARSLDEDAQRQRLALEEQLNVARQRRMRQLQGKHQKAKEREAAHQQQELRELQTEQRRRQEEEVLRPLFTGENAAANQRRAKQLVERVQRARHRLERAEQLKDEWAETTAKVQEKLSAVFEEVQQRRVELIQQRAAGAVSEEQFAEAMAELDERLAVDPALVQQEVEAELQVQHRERRERLREQQLDEVKAIVRKFNPAEDFSGPEWQLDKVDMQALLAQRAEKRREEEARIAAEMARLKREEEEFKREQERKLQEAMREFDSRLEEERVRAAQELERRVREEQATLLQEKEAAAKKKLEAMQSSGLDEERKQQILSEYEDELERERQAQQVELLRQKEKFQQRLQQQQEIRRKRELKRQQELQQNALAAEKERLHAQEQALEQEKEAKRQRQDAVFKEAAQTFIACGALRARRRRAAVAAAARWKERVAAARRQRGGAPAAGSAAAADGRPQYARGLPLLPPSQLAAAAAQAAPGVAAAAAAAGVPAMVVAVADGSAGAGAGVGVGSGGGDAGGTLLARLQGLERSLTALMEAEGVAAPAEAQGEPGAQLWVDPLEKKLEPKGAAPETCAAESLSATAFVVYRFARSVVELLNVFRAPVHLLLANSLPPKGPKYALDNAFRNSYHYDPPTRTLFLHRARAQSAGDAAVAVVHAMAHLRAADKHWSDADPRFRKELYRCLRVLYGDLFTRSQQRAEEVANVITLEQAREEGDADVFAPAYLAQRMQRYKTFQFSAQLRSHLREVESDFRQRADEALLESKSEAAGENKEGAAAAAAAVEAPAPRSKEKQLEDLEQQFDTAHKELLPVVEKIRELSLNVLQLSEEPTRRRELESARAHLKRLSLQKEALYQRMQQLEQRLANKRRELLS